jgi:ubiquitin-conjugating enzyme E2 D/E
MARRIQNELSRLKAESVESIAAEPCGDDIFHWRATLRGPEGSPYAGGTFRVDIKFPYDYPLKPPACKFDTKVYHPNISPTGHICLEILQDWNPSQKAQNILISLLALLSMPDPDNPLASEIAEQYRADRVSFDRIAKEWTEKYGRD